MNTGNKLQLAPLITVAMPVYNAGPHLSKALRSVLAQSYRNWELLLIDDGSTDDAIEQARLLLTDPRIKVLVDEQNRGITARLNQAIDLAKGQFFARMDQDDICYPQRFARQVEWLLENPNLDLVAVRAITISPDGHAVGYFPFRKSHKEITAMPWNGFYFPHPTWMGRTHWFRKYRYSTRLCEDQGLLLRSYTSSTFATIPEILFAYRLRSQFSWCASTKTRWACMKEKVEQFLSQRAPLWAILSVIVFVAKVVGDLFFIKFFGRRPSAEKNFPQLTEHDMVQWMSVLDELEV
jgi:glycosyltransferase involved in cell wall biosynthesis